MSRRVHEETQRSGSVVRGGSGGALRQPVILTLRYIFNIGRGSVQQKPARQDLREESLVACSTLKSLIPGPDPACRLEQFAWKTQAAQAQRRASQAAAITSLCSLPTTKECMDLQASKLQPHAKRDLTQYFYTHCSLHLEAIDTDQRLRLLLPKCMLSVHQHFMQRA